MSDFAIHETITRRQPSVERGNVTKWILWPAFFGMVSGGFFFLGVALIYRAYYSGVGAASFGFLVGSAFFGLGLGGGATIAVKSLSFDNTNQTSETKRVPVLIHSNETEKPMSGNKPVIVASRRPVIVEHNGKRYNWTPEQLNRAQDRFDDENWQVARDHLGIATGDYAAVKYIMMGLGLWESADNGTNVEWSQKGIDWHEIAMRKIAPH